jgi:hypothetical protein
MPPKKTQRQLKPSVSGNFSYNGTPFTLPVDEHKTTAKHIVNHIRICPEVTLSPARKLINAAIQQNCLHITIGVPPGSPKTDQTAAAPDFYYEGSDLMQLETLMQTENTMLNCTATLVIGDGGFDVANDEDAHDACHLVKETIREPSLCLFF